MGRTTPESLPASHSARRRRPGTANLVKAELKAGGNGWDTIRWKQDLLERTSIAIAVANFRLIDAHTRAS